MRKISLQYMILILLVSMGIAAENNIFQEVSPFRSSKLNVNSIEAIWDLQDSLNLVQVTGAAGNAGAEFDGSYYYTTRWATNLIHKIDLAGNLVEEFSIAGVTGLRDLAFDGTYMYGGAAGNTIFQMNFNTKTLIGTITSPVAVRFIAYDEGADAFWVGNWADPPTRVDRSGNILDTLTTGLAGQYGAAYDNWTAGGPYLWIFDQGTGSGLAQIIHQFNIASGTATGVTHDVLAELGPNTSAIAGGLWTGTGITPGTVSIGGLLQGTPDMLFVYELGPEGTSSELQLISPNGGEIWRVGSAQLIQWISNNGPPLVRLDYSVDAGANWILIATDIPVGGGQYAWSIPNTPSEDCLVRISDAVDGNPFDVSDAPFIISAVPRINILRPNGGENWLAGSGETIQWTSTTPTDPVNVKIEFTTDGGGSWTEIVASTPNDGDYVWAPIPNTPSTDCLVRISDAVDGNPSDVSDAPFSIVGAQLTLQSPNGGEDWPVNSNQLIRWVSTLPNDPPDVKLEYSIDAGGSWNEIIASTPNDGEYTWTVLALPSTNCLVRVSDAIDGDPFDVSDAPFTISVVLDLTLSRPNGGETFLAGEAELIQWSSAIPTLPSNVKLDYSTNGGGTWTDIISSTPNDGEFVWTVPSTPGTNCLVRVSDAVDGEPADTSDAPFTILTSSITVTDPGSGQSWEVSSTLSVGWNSIGNVGNVKIEISRNNGSSWSTIIASTPNDGSQDWIVQMPRSTQCRIRVSDVQTPAVSGVSGTFTINPQQRPDGITRPAAQPSGTAQNAYRLFSVPLNLENPDPASVLEDDLGAYNNTVWRFWDYENSDYSEYPNTRNFSPGRSFFLIVKDGGKIIDTGPGVQVADSVVAVELDSGWNFIANPYNFPISVSGLSISTDLQTYNSNGWVPQTADLQPWEGYIVWAGAPTILQIRPGIEGSAIMAKITATSHADWSLQIKAHNGEAKDYHNFAGVIEGAADSWDGYDSHEPPYIGEYVSVYFPHQDWNVYPGNYSSDLKSPGANGYTWQFDVESNIRGEITLSFEGMTKIPQEFEVKLIDPILKYEQDLRMKQDYSLYNRSEEQNHPMTILVGTPDYVQQSLQGLDLIAREFRLFDNFPNPFNLSTTILFNLPQAENITMKIYNVLGEQVASLFDNKYHEAGLHKVYWDGKDRFGVDLASGIYLYRLEAGNFVQVKKMLLVK